MSEHAEHCRRCGEYHYADTELKAAQLADDCEAGNW